MRYLWDCARVQVPAYTNKSYTKSTMTSLYENRFPSNSHIEHKKRSRNSTTAIERKREYKITKNPNNTHLFASAMSVACHSSGFFFFFCCPSIYLLDHFGPSRSTRRDARPSFSRTLLLWTWGTVAYIGRKAARVMMIINFDFQNIASSST